jgi:hypothetical protein
MRWIADYGRLARRISPQLARPSHGLRAVGEATASPDFSTARETMRWIACCTRTDLLNGFLHSRRHHAKDCGLWTTCPPNLSTACQTMRRIAGCRASDCLAGFLHSRRDHAMDCGLWAACPPNLSRTCQTMRRIAGRRGSERLTGFVHGRRDRAIDCGGHAGGYNGHQREQCGERVGRCRLGGKHRSESRL